MTTELITKYSNIVDEKMVTEGKTGLITNSIFDFTGAKTVKVYKVTSAPMGDYDRNGKQTDLKRYGEAKDLEATTQDMTIKRDRAFTYVIDKLDEDETGVLTPGFTMDRQLQEVIIPEIDTYVINEMIKGAGTKSEPEELTSDNIYDKILEATEALDDAEVPETNRYLLVTPKTNKLLKQSKDFLMSTDIAQQDRVQGVIAMVDGLTVIKVPKARVPKDFGFMMCHPIATVAPVKLLDLKIHENPPGVSGSLVEGRVVYDAFVADNKKNAIYYKPVI